MKPSPIKHYPESHQVGRLSVYDLQSTKLIPGLMCDVGVQIANDGRIWLCVNGEAFIRFKPSSRYVQEHAISAIVEVGAGPETGGVATDIVSMTDLKTRLLAVKKDNDGYFDGHVTHWHQNPDGPDAVAEIERLEARIASLEAPPTDAEVDAAASIFGSRMNIREWEIMCEEERAEYRHVSKKALIAAAQRVKESSR